MFSNVHWMHLIKLKINVKILNLRKSFVRVAKKMVMFFCHLVNCLYSLCLKFVAPSVGHMHRN
jgi:hypothetical protein